jgi:hypothetical protein
MVNGDGLKMLKAFGKEPRKDYSITVYDAELDEYSKLQPMTQPMVASFLNRITGDLNISRIKIVLADANVIVIDKGQNVDTYA